MHFISNCCLLISIFLPFSLSAMEHNKTEKTYVAPFSKLQGKLTTYSPEQQKKEVALHKKRIIDFIMEMQKSLVEKETATNLLLSISKSIPEIHRSSIAESTINGEPLFFKFIAIPMPQKMSLLKAFISQYKANINAVDWKGQTFLHRLVAINDPKKQFTIQNFIKTFEEDIKVSVQDQMGQTPLHLLALQKPDNETHLALSVLLTNSIVNIQDLNGDTAAHIAARTLKKYSNDNTKNWTNYDGIYTLLAVVTDKEITNSSNRTYIQEREIDSNC